MNSFFTSQFNYRPFVWMFHSRTMNNKINHLHERFLRIVYSVLFERLIERDKFVQIHIRNLQILAIEIFKVSKDLIFFQNEVFSRTCVTLLSSLFET